MEANWKKGRLTGKKTKTNWKKTEKKRLTEKRHYLKKKAADWKKTVANWNHRRLTEIGNVIVNITCNSKDFNWHDLSFNYTSFPYEV